MTVSAYTLKGVLHPDYARSLTSQTAFSSFIFGREEKAVWLARLVCMPCVDGMFNLLILVR